MTPVRAYVVALVVVTAGLAIMAAAFGLPWLTLLAVLGIVATRGWARVLIGVILSAAGVAAAVTGVVELLESGAGASILGAVGGAVLAVGGAWTVGRGRTWPSMGARFDGQRAASRTSRPMSAWDAQDRGLDPTDDSDAAASG